MNNMLIKNIFAALVLQVPRVLTSGLAITALLMLPGCFDLDSNLFNSTELTSYTLSTAIIPDSLRSEIILDSQGKKIYGYFVRSVNSSEKKVILYNHGNRDHLQFYWDRVELFYKMGFNVFIYDYQGYGKSEGEPSESAVYSDAIAAYHYVQSRGFGDGQISVYGFSLGGAPATHLASSVFTPHRLILEAAFASASSLTQSGTLLDLPSSFFMKGSYNNAEKIRSVTAPVLILHGVDDTFIDMTTNGSVLFQNANEPKSYIVVPGADHSQVPWKMGEGNYIDTVKSFIR